MLVPSMSPAQGHMQVRVLVRAPGAARGADSLRTYSGHMPGLAEGYGGAPGHAHLEMGSAATPLRARDGAPGQLPSHGMRDSDALQRSDRQGRNVSLLIPTGGLRVLKAPLRLRSAHHTSAAVDERSSLRAEETMCKHGVQVGTHRTSP